MKIGENVPVDRWHYAEKVTGPAQINDECNLCWWTDEIDASDGPTAERRVFEVIAHDYEDDASSYEYLAQGEASPGRWWVRVNAPGEY